ncbi:DEHA2C16192p [Debaryomyces hansenii CBS767]|uniref:DEHA2C16192p n=1 Tax=Debaryomyces hansenii (strain ATCC 36239 / CBS 767 / BCRC 21394 / JCM 1990 / NBRC 0083 / IGC 2968) TaxID=284592 RepID=Q6BTS8_DEBHA|nr:DEHA2C16192p [Debaryomyces hansenii CBS767]CAG86473.2 DEHA2C16192p [Debaryomyces hansenii CBS767]|eukprot:XP_458391.2 DEHA2C16192p [Debaryomyces hansenii CBS767]
MATEESNNKESPLTDIATSPPPFDLTLDNKELENDQTSNFISNKANSGQESQENNSKTNRDSYESSELSDLGEDESEAETDKMDFLDDDPNSSGEKVSDLNAISKLTELAHLKEVDSDNEDDENVVKEEQSAPHEEDGEKSVKETEETSETNTKIEESSSDGEMSINPKENAEANKEIMEDLERISQSVEDGTNRRPSKRSISEPDQTNNKKPKMESEEEPNTGKTGEDVPDNVLNDEHENSDVEESQKDDLNNGNSNSGEDEENDDANNGTKTDDQEADEEDEDADEMGDFESSEKDVDINEKRKLAIEELIIIESSFAELRDKLYQDKLNLLEHELQLCLEGSHPELSRIYYKINQFHQDSLKQANSNLNYKLKCIDVSTIASRTSIHQNFLKKLMDCKNDMITDTTSLWYKINKERNQLDQLVPDYNFTAIPSIPNYTATVPIEEGANGVANGILNGHEIAPLSKKTIKQNTVFELVEQRNNLNCQLGILNGLLQFHGLPSALYSNVDDNFVGPSQELLLRKATDDEINEDLRAMGIPM